MIKSSVVRSARTVKKQDKTKIHVSGLQIGMHICELDRPWLETPFLMQGFLLETPQDIECVAEVCEYVYIDEVRDTLVRPEERIVSNRNQSKPRYIHKVPSNQEHSKIHGFHREARGITKTLLDEVRLGNALNMKQVKQTVSECVDSILRNQFALLWLSQIKDKDDYLAEHSLNVAILAITFGRHLQLPEEDLEKLGVCGMLHDVGKTKIPEEILNKPSKLNREEFAIMRQHTTFGSKLLVGKSDVYSGAVDVAHNHHEMLDGSGYPRGLKDHKLNPFTRMITLVDIYDAMTSERCYKAGNSSLSALKILYAGKGTKYDSHLVTEFIKCIGLYPVGNLVELKNGCVAIVVSNNYQNRRLPRIHLLLNENKKPVDGYVIDTAKVKNNEKMAGYEIVNVLPAGCHGLKLQELIERGIKLE